MLLNKKYFILVIIFAGFVFSGLVAAGISNAWPKINSLNESECLILEDYKILVESGVYTKEFSIHSKFLLVNAEGEIYTNAVLKKSFDTLTFSVERKKKASYKEKANYRDCYRRMDLEIGAYSEKYVKLYIVVDKVVKYEFIL